MSTFTIELSTHAIERFAQRVRPGLDPAAAAEQLAQLALAGELRDEPPSWHLAGAAQIAPWYLVIADIVLPLRPHRSEPGVLVATTCLAREGRGRFRREQARRLAAYAEVS